MLADYFGDPSLNGVRIASFVPPTALETFLLSPFPLHHGMMRSCQRRGE